MARYVQTELARGLSPDGVRVVSAANLERTWQPGVATSLPPGTPAELAAISSQYGLGWAVGTYGGQRLVWHAGATNGFNALAAFLPDADVGLVVLTNRNGTGAILGLAAQFRLLELLFDRPATFDTVLGTVLSGQATARADLLARLGQVDPAAVTPYLGRYANPDLGEATLALRAGKLIFDAGTVRSALLPRLDAAGAATDYLFVDPPWATNSPTRSLTFGPPTGGRARIVLTEQVDPGEADLVYVYDPVAAARSAPSSD
jgi:hypothetical protein